MEQKRIGGSVGLVKDEKGRDVIDPPAKHVWWYQEQNAWPKPGYPGPSVLVSHISHKGQPGDFWKLRDVRKGDHVTVLYSSGDKVSFVVTNVKRPVKVELPPDIWKDTGKPVLRLVTCDPDTPFVNGHYLGNVLVYADRMV